MDEMNFTCWKEKMKFLLTAFKVYYVLEGPPIGVMTEEEHRKRKNNKGNDKKRKGTWNSSKNNKKDKKPLSEVVCYKCGEKGHIKRYCKNPKKKNQNSNKKDESANAVEQACSFMLCDLDFEPLSLSLSSMPSCDLVSLTNILILCLILKALFQSLRKSLSLNLELSR
ncbi:retrovirus-related pol polyprotein from transposon TNT 1-94 [Tanacetum coccineum]